LDTFIDCGNRSDFLIGASTLQHTFYIHFEVEFTFLTILPMPLFNPRIYESCFWEEMSEQR
jgi:hypothetical protein